MELKVKNIYKDVLSSVNDFISRNENKGDVGTEDNNNNVVVNQEKPNQEEQNKEEINPSKQESNNEGSSNSNANKLPATGGGSGLATIIKGSMLALLGLFIRRRKDLDK
ncbi:LPXTG cell wall anchor domain-containing protein [Clostridium disporicum]|uniref:LPXTG cell wall anchor domain-containing protein n=1 Tax=Clostridium disporicum TaxID=84024 RepID=UPI0011DDF0BB